MKIDGPHIAEVSRAVDPRGRDWFAALPTRLDAKQHGDRRADPEGDQRPAAVPGRCRARLSHPVAQLRHPVGRREPAHPPGLADRLGPDRRALCAGRAVDRPAPARQRPAADTLKRLRDLGNSVLVVEHDEEAILHRRLCHRHGPGAGIHGGEIVAAGHAGRHHGQPESAHRRTI